jgi:hypothetical protein
MDALHDNYIYPLAACGVALLMTFAMENKNIKTIGKEREQARAGTFIAPEGAGKNQNNAFTQL